MWMLVFWLKCCCAFVCIGLVRCSWVSFNNDWRQHCMNGVLLLQLTIQSIFGGNHENGYHFCTHTHTHTHGTQHTKRANDINLVVLCYALPAKGNLFIYLNWKKKMKQYFCCCVFRILQITKWRYQRQPFTITTFFA